MITQSIFDPYKDKREKRGGLKRRSGIKQVPDQYRRKGKYYQTKQVEI